MHKLGNSNKLYDEMRNPVELTRTKIFLEGTTPDETKTSKELIIVNSEKLWRHMKRKNIYARPSGRPRRNFSLLFLHSHTGKLSCILKKLPCIRAEVCAVQITSGGNLRSSGISRLSVRSLLSFLCGPRGKNGAPPQNSQLRRLV